MNTTLTPPDRHHVSFDRVDRVDSKMVPSFEGESSPTPARKTPLQLYYQTKFRRERARDVYRIEIKRINIC